MSDEISRDLIKEALLNGLVTMCEEDRMEILAATVRRTLEGYSYDKTLQDILNAKLRPLIHQVFERQDMQELMRARAEAAIREMLPRIELSARERSRY